MKMGNKSNVPRLHTDGSEKFINDICSNVSSDLIEITEDKLRCKLQDFESNTKKINNSFVPLSLLFPLIITLFTTKEYNKFLGLDSKTIIVLAIAASIVFFIFKFKNYIKYKNMTGIEYLIDVIKNNNYLSPSKDTDNNKGKEVATGEFFHHGLNGRIRSKDSIIDDPYPPKS